MKVKLLEPIAGFEDVAEYRVPQEQERFAREDGRVYTAFTKHPREELVVTPIKRWRQATIDDAVRAIRGELVVARFRNHDTSEWKQSELVGFLSHGDYRWMAKEPFVGFCKCEVLDA